MKTKLISTILMTISLGAFSATVATAQEGHATAEGASQAATQTKDEMAHDHMMVANEPHYVLATAYHQNLLAFAKALQGQTAGAVTVNVEFARAAVSEMRRSFDHMKYHHQDHVGTMSAEMRTKMSGMIQQMETHQTELNTQLTALGREVQLTGPDVAKVAALAASVHTHLDAMSEMAHGSSANKMTMKY